MKTLRDYCNEMETRPLPLPSVGEIVISNDGIEYRVESHYLDWVTVYRAENGVTFRRDLQPGEYKSR